MTTKTLTFYTTGYHLLGPLTALTITANGSVGSSGVYSLQQAVYTVVNYGHVGPTNSGVVGVRIGGGGRLINEVGATISGAGRGVSIGDNYTGRATGSYAYVTNYGRILGGTDSGVYFGYNDLHAGVIVNGATGNTAALIAGLNGISDPSGSAYTVHTITNFGTVSGTGAAGTGGILIKSNTSEDIVNGSALDTHALIAGDTGVLAATTNYGHENFITLTNFGTIHGTGGSAVNFLSTSDRLIEEGSGVILGSVAGARGTLELAADAGTGTIAGLGTSITNFATLVFDTGAHWTVGGTYSATGLGGLTISGFGNGDTIDLSGFLATSSTFASNQLTLTSATNTHQTLAIQGTFAANAFTVNPDGHGGTDIVACFLPGTLIQTERGEVAVEDLAIGDVAIAASGRRRPLRWIGVGKGLATRGRRTAATPIVVRKGALADNVPHTDLHITKGHSLYLDGVLIPAEFLVNHRSILWDDAKAGEVTVYHLELDGHDVLLANGAPAESYRDDGNRWLFQNANASWDQPPAAPCAPVVTGGPVVDAVWERLLGRAGRSAPALTSDPDLHLIVDGQRLDPFEKTADGLAFYVPIFPQDVRIASRAAAPDVLGIARDSRILGVGIRWIDVQRGYQFDRIHAEDERLTEGFHPHEPANGLRWTNGHARLPEAAFAKFGGGGFRVELATAGATRFPVETPVALRAAA